MRGENEREEMEGSRRGTCSATNEKRGEIRGTGPKILGIDGGFVAGSDPAHKGYDGSRRRRGEDVISR